MFRPMRRKNQLLSQPESEAILLRNTAGTLALMGDEGYPYAVPMSYVYEGGKIFFHCATEGHKLDAVRRCEKASFCVIDQDAVVPEKLTTLYCSVIAFGRIRILEEEAEVISALKLLGYKYAPAHPHKVQEEITDSMPRLRVMVLTIDHMTGKECIELVHARKDEAMAKDLLFREEDFVFSCRVGAVIVQGGMALLQRLPGEEGYAFIGGHVAAGETFEAALRRELKEELRTDAAIGPMLAMGEAFIPWGKKPCHQLAPYFAAVLPEGFSPKDGSFQAMDELEGRRIGVTFEWVPVEKLQGLPVYPPQVMQWVLDPARETGHFVYTELDEGAFGSR